jgi:hypothetical protein
LDISRTPWVEGRRRRTGGTVIVIESAGRIGAVAGDSIKTEPPPALHAQMRPAHACSLGALLAVK